MALSAEFEPPRWSPGGANQRKSQVPHRPWVHVLSSWQADCAAGCVCLPALTLRSSSTSPGAVLVQASWCTTRPVEPHLSDVGNVEACGASTSAVKGLIMDLHESSDEHGEAQPPQLDPTPCMPSPLIRRASLCASAGSRHRHMCNSNMSPAHSRLRCVFAT